MRTRDNETVTDPVSEARRYVANAHTLLIEKADLNRCERILGKQQGVA